MQKSTSEEINLVGLVTDGANVMIGKKNYFRQKMHLLKSKINSVLCPSHIGNLIVQKAQKSIPLSIITLLQKAHSYFSQSSIKSE